MMSTDLHLTDHHVSSASRLHSHVRGYHFTGEEVGVERPRTCLDDTAPLQGSL